MDRLGVAVVAGFSTHPHWDHLLWHARFGDAPRYATADGVRVAGEARERAQAMAAASAAGIPLELVGLLTPIPATGGVIPGELIEHDAHAVGHAAILLADRGVLIPGHGSVAQGPEVAARLTADRAYLDALRQGEESLDARLAQEWLAGAPSERQVS